MFYIDSCLVSLFSWLAWSIFENFDSFIYKYLYIQIIFIKKKKYANFYSPLSTPNNKIS